MLSMSKNLLIRNGGRLRPLKWEAYTEKDVEHGHNLSKMHIGRLKKFQVENLKEYDDQINEDKYWALGCFWVNLLI